MAVFGYCLLVVSVMLVLVSLGHVWLCGLAHAWSSREVSPADPRRLCCRRRSDGTIFGLASSIVGSSISRLDQRNMAGTRGCQSSRLALLSRPR